ncbi:FAD-dependent oxidoreductase, partial [bacterium]|nr:FAD-dependent oxidoreductase [bacterium]
MNELQYPVIIIGSGISGLYTALKLEQSLQYGKVLILTKNQLTDSNSYYAQGGMVAVLKDNTNDSVELHLKDTLIAGAGLSEAKTVTFISKNSDKVVRDLLNFGVDFDKENGEFTLTKEAAHSVNRILHSGGDATGREMEIALANSVKNNKNIEVRENTIVVDLITKNNTCLGVTTYKDGKYEKIYSNSVILATGGLGQLYKYTTNPIGASADGFALAYRAGAKLRDMEFVQFHPTALAIDDPINHNRILISEAVRGEGAKLCDKNGVEYMHKYDKRKELAPRDIVARANFTQMQENNLPNVYLNATVIGKEKLLKRFPTIAKKCAEDG